MKGKFVSLFILALILSINNSFSQKNKVVYPELKETTLIVGVGCGLTEKQKKDTAYVNAIERFDKNLKEMVDLVWDLNAKIEYKNIDVLNNKEDIKQLQNLYFLHRNIDVDYDRTSMSSRSSGGPVYTESGSTPAIDFGYYGTEPYEHKFVAIGISNDPCKYEIGVALLQIKSFITHGNSLPLDGYKQIEKKTLLIDVDMLKPELSKEMVQQIYKYPVEVLTEQEINNKFLSKDNKYSYLTASPTTMGNTVGLLIINSDGSCANYQIPSLSKRKFNNNRKYIHFLSEKTITKIYKEMEKDIAKK